MQTSVKLVEQKLSDHLKIIQSNFELTVDLNFPIRLLKLFYSFGLIFLIKQRFFFVIGFSSLYIYLNKNKIFTDIFGKKRPFFFQLNSFTTQYFDFGRFYFRK
jgi:hypothetical protein